MMGMPCARAAATSGTCSSTAVETIERRAILAQAAAVLRNDRDAEALELLAQAFTLAAVECAVAAAGCAAGHHLELSQRAHAGPAEPRIVKAALALGIGHRPRFRSRDEHEIALAQLREELAHMVVRKPHATMRDGPSEQAFVIGAVQIDIALQRIAPISPIDAVFEAIKGEDAGEDQIVVARVSAPRLAGRLA